MRTRFGKKFRIISALEKGNILLLTHLLAQQNHPPEKPVDKLGNNIFHIACRIGNLQMTQYLFNTYHFDINLYNTDGINPIHHAAYGGHFDTLQWLCENGADCYSKTRHFNLTAYDIVCNMLSKNKPPTGEQAMTQTIKIELIRMKDYLRAKYFLDHRGKEIRKFIWVCEKLKEKNQGFGRLTHSMIREIGEYI